MSQWKLCIALLISSVLFSSVVLAGTYGRFLCKSTPEEYRCQRVKDGQSWQSLWPDANKRQIVMRVNRMNTQIYGGLVIAVPRVLDDTDVMDFSPFPRQIDSPYEKLLIFDPLVQAWGAYDSEGILIRWGPASGGMDWCDDINESCHTDEGTFRVYSLGSSNCISKKFPLPDGGSPMPYCMFFNEGFAFHGSPNGLPGFHASHGCIRLFVQDAEWLRYDFVEPPNPTNHYRGTKVIIGPYSEAGVDN